VSKADPRGENEAMTTFPDSHRDLLDAQVASLATTPAIRLKTP